MFLEVVSTVYFKEQIVSSLRKRFQKIKKREKEHFLSVLQDEYN